MTKVEQDQRRACRMSRLVRGLFGAAALSGLVGASGCGLGALGSSGGAVSSSGSGARAGSLIEQRREAFKIDYDLWAGLGYRLDWRGFPVVQARQHITLFTPYDDIVVAMESASTLSVLEASNGALRNSSQVASALTRFVGSFRIDNTIVVASDNEMSFVDAQTGDITQRQHLDRVVTTAPVYAAGQAIFGTSIGHVYARMLNPAINSWAFDMGTPIDAELALVGPTVVAVARDGSIAMLDAASGTLVGRASIFGGCEADPVAGEGMVYLASLDQSVYGFSTDGTQRWRVRTEQPLRVTPTYNAGVLYVASADQGLRAIDGLTGEQKWNQDQVAGRVVAVRSGRLITWDGQTVATVDPATGDVVRTAKLPEVQTLRADKLVDGNLYAISKGGIVARFIPKQ